MQGGAVSVFAQVVKFLVSLGSMVVLARLLTPRDFGMFGMVAAFTGLLRVFRDGGLSTATMQRERITHAQVSTLFWLNLALGIAFTGVAVLLAPLVATFYRDPRLAGLTIAVASTFLLGSLAVQHHALLCRQMRFGALAIIEVLGTLAGAIGGIVMACRGWQYWSLAGVAIMGALTTVVGKFVAARWRPGLPRRGCGVRSLLRFGGTVTGSDVVNYSFRNADNILIGWYWGAGAVGLYSRAYGLLMLVINLVTVPLSNVAVSALSRLQSRPGRLREFFVNAYATISSITLPLLVVLLIFADDFVNVVLGPKWDGSIMIFRVLAPAAICGALLEPLTWLLIATGQPHRHLRVSLVWTLLVIGAFVAGLPAGAVGVAAGFSVMACLLTIPYVAYAVRQTPVTMPDIFRSLRAPAGASLAAGAFAVIVKFELLAHASPVVGAVVGSALTFAAYGAALMAFGRPRARVRDLLRQLAAAKESRGRGGGSGSAGEHGPTAAAGTPPD